MGPTHAAQGWSAGLLVAHLAGLGVRESIAAALVAAAFAVWPDLDHPQATVTNRLGFAGDIACAALRGTSAMAYRLTKGPRDEDWAGTHRHLSHTAVFAAITGCGVALATAAWAWRAVLAVALLAVWIGIAALGRWFAWAAAIVAAWWLIDAARSPGGIPVAAAGLNQLAWWLGAAVATGCLAHCLGDACTEMGCPVVWPWPIAGETWYELRLPELLRVRTGGSVERRLIRPAFAALDVLLVPGVWQMILGAFHPSPTI